MKVDTCQTRAGATQMRCALPNEDGEGGHAAGFGGWYLYRINEYILFVFHSVMHRKWVQPYYACHIYIGIWCYGELLNQPCNGTTGHYVLHSGNNTALWSTMDFWQLTMMTK